MQRRRVLVVGSANMDMVVSADRFPKPGETILGGAFGMYPGGKGANQAVAAAKVGGRVDFVAKMGNDVFRTDLLTNLRRQGVSVKHIAVDAAYPTGIALITVDSRGQNQIVVFSGSNMRLTASDVDRRRSVFATAAIVLLQLEIPFPTVMHTARHARRMGTPVVLNPAPARRLPVALLRMVDYLTPNETELEQLSGVRVRGTGSAARAARRLLDRGVRNVLVTLGPAGCLLVNRSTVRVFPARRVRAVDTTAAGDAFNGALATALAAREDVTDAIPFANAVAALSVTKMGAQSSMPSLREVRSYMRSSVGRP